MVADKSHGQEVMRCTFLGDNYLCGANKECQVPSLVEFRKYCKSKHYKSCQVYLKAIMASWSFCQRPTKLVPPRIVRIE